MAASRPAAAQRDLGCQQVFDHGRTRGRAALDPGEYIVQRLQRARPLEVGKLDRVSLPP